MISWLLNYLKTRTWMMFSQSGFVSSGQGMAPGEDNVIAIFVGSLLGALIGLLGGFMVSHALRFVSLLTGRHLGGFSWVILGAVAGAVVFGCMAAWRDDA